MASESSRAPPQPVAALSSNTSEASESQACLGTGPRTKKLRNSGTIRMLLSPGTSSLAPRSAPTTAESYEHAGQSVTTASLGLGSASISLSHSQSQSHTASTTTSAATAPSAHSASSASRSAPARPSASTQRSIAEARAAVVADMGNMLDSKLQGRAAVLHANATAIARQERDVERALDALRRDDDRLFRLASDTASKVKEVGNVQNFAEMMERDFLIVEDTLRRARARAARAADGGENGHGEDGGSEEDDGWTGSESGSWGTSASREGSAVLGEGPRIGGREAEAVEEVDGPFESRESAKPLADSGKGETVRQLG